MKKYLFFAAALVAFASCSSDSLVGENNNSPDLNPVSASGEKAIVFNSGANAITRADYTGVDAANKLGRNFVVFGFKGNGTTKTTVFDHYNVNWQDNTAHTTTSNTANWEYVAQTKHAHATTYAQTIKYWDYATTQYDFIAWSMGTATAVYANEDYDVDANVLITETTPATMTSSTDGAYTIKGKAENLAKVYIADLVTAYRDKDAENDALGDYQKEVDITFRSLSAKIRVALYETVPGYSVQAGSVKFYNADNDASPNTTAKLFTTAGTTDVFNVKGTYTVYYPTTGYASSPNGTSPNTDYNKAHVKFNPEATGGTDTKKEFGTLNSATFVKEEVDENNDNTTENGEKLYIGRSSNTATYAGLNTEANPNYYTIVIPNETGAVLNLKVDYTLLSTDGSGETIKVTGATAQVPAVYATWKSGYAYTYLFKISQNTNGETNPSAGPAGLYPITFDAVVTETEDHVQETITTVATPSITTYSKGVVVTDNNEYTTGSTIYAIVENGTKLTVGTNANLYTVTLASGAAQTINEASVANAIEHGGAYSPFVVTDANGKAMTVTTAAGLTAVTEIAATDSPDGNAITVNGAKFTAGAAGTIYAFEYIEFTGSVPVADTDLVANGYYTVSDGVYTVCTSGTADGTATYYKPGPKHYKIIKIKE